MFRSILFGAALTLVALPASAQAPSFKGKTVTIITSTGPGGGYDLTARTIARHMSRYLPGAPSVIVQNMPGGGNVLATNYMYNIAPKDGTKIATVNNAIPLHQVIDSRGVRYDASKFNWLGSTAVVNEMLFVWHTTGLRTIQDAMKKSVVLGGTGPASDIVIIPTVMNKVLGTKFKIVIGYKSSERINIAMERGEVQARVLSLSSLAIHHPDWIKEHKVRFLVQVGSKRDKALPDVPLLTELAKTKEQREILKLISSSVSLGKPYLAPPGVPAGTVAVLRKAFADTMKDKAFLSEAGKLHIDVDPMTGDEVAQVVRDTIATPADVVAKTRAVMPERKARKKKKR